MVDNVVRYREALYEAMRCFSRDLAKIIAEYTYHPLPTSGVYFSFRHHPYVFGREWPYIEWLVGISIQLGRDYPQYHRHKYNPLTDTIAIVESHILVTIGRLEMNAVECNSQKLLAGSEQFLKIHPMLQKYASRPKYSPLSARYLDGAKDSEANAISNVNALIARIHQEEKKIDRRLIHDQDSRVMAIAEDTLLSVLARLQFLHGRVVNTCRVGAEELFDANQQRFLTNELRNYLDTFQVGHETKPVLPLSKHNNLTFES